MATMTGMPEIFPRYELSAPSPTGHAGPTTLNNIVVNDSVLGAINAVFIGDPADLAVMRTCSKDVYGGRWCSRCCNPAHLRVYGSKARQAVSVPLDLL